MDLWTEWVTHYEKIGLPPHDICKDGALNKKLYDESKPKLLFVLRETNDYPGGSLSELLRDGPRWQMWHAVARWAACIFYPQRSFDEIDNFSTMKVALAKVAAINLKKLTGGASSHLPTVNAFAYADRELLKKQIQYLSPDIIIACGTFDSLIWLLHLEFNPNNPTVNAIRCKQTNSWVIPWCHPARINNKKTFDKLRQLVTPVLCDSGK
jgi:hypothetical protein